MCIRDRDKAGELQKLQISKLEELRNEAYENAKILKDRVKVFHDKDKKFYSITLDFISFSES